MIRKIPTLAGADVTTHSYSLIFEIGDQPHTFFFRYSRRMRRWVLTIERGGVRVVTGAVIVHGVDLFSYSAPGTRPEGFLFCNWTTNADGAPEPEEFDLGRRSVLLHFERAADLTDTGPQVPGLA